MHRYMQAAVVCSALILLPVLLAGAGPQPIGFARSESEFAVGSAMVQGNSTLFAGDDVGSLDFAIRLNLKDGPRYTLSIDSEGLVYQDRFLLRSGSVEMIHAGKPARVVASSVSVATETPGAAAIVYLRDKGAVTVLVHNGEVKVARVGGGPLTTLRAGDVVSFKSGPRGNLRVDSDGALREVNQAQAEQLVNLVEASKGFGCLLPRVEKVSSEFENLSTRLAAYQATKSAIQTRFERGIATQSDQQVLASLNNDFRTLTTLSGSFSADLNNVIFQHSGGSAPISPFHTIHDHLQVHCHHGQHGHTIVFHDPAPCPVGQHAAPPHSP